MKRCRTGALAVLLLVATASLAGWFTFFAPAGAEGLDFACKSNDEVADPLAEEAPEIDGASLHFRGTSQTPMPGHAEQPDGTYVKEIPDPYFMDGHTYIDVDGDDNIDFVFGLFARATTKDVLGTHTGLQELYTSSFAFPPDDVFNPGHVFVAGIDAFLLTDPGFAQTVGYEAELSLILHYKTESNATIDKWIDLSFATDVPGDVFPHRAHVTPVLKVHPAQGENPRIEAWGIGKYFGYDEIDPALEEQPGFRAGVTVADVDAEDNPDTAAPTVKVDLRWDHTPRWQATGFYGQCMPWDPSYGSTGYLAWQRTPDVTAPADMNLNLDILVGAGQGIKGHDTFDLEGRFVGIPQRFDWVMHPKRMDLLHSPDVSPQVDLDDLVYAADDPNTAEDRPLVAYDGHIQDLAPHMRIVTRNQTDDENDPVGKMRGARVMSCPALPGAPDDSPEDFPEDGRAILPGETEDTAPEIRPGCEDAATTKRVRVTVQNFFEGEVNTGGILDVPEDLLPTQPLVLWSSQERRFQLTGDQLAQLHVYDSLGITPPPDLAFVPDDDGDLTGIEDVRDPDGDEPPTGGGGYAPPPWDAASPEYWRLALNVFDVEDVDVDTTPEGDGDSNVDVSAETGGGENGLIHLRIDKRNSLVEDLNVGTVTTARAAVEHLPLEVLAHLQSNEEWPVILDYEASSAVAAAGSVQVVLPGRDVQQPMPWMPPSLGAQLPATHVFTDFQVGDYVYDPGDPLDDFDDFAPPAPPDDGFDIVDPGFDDVGVGDILPPPAGGLPTELSLEFRRQHNENGTMSNNLVYDANAQAHVLAGIYIDDRDDRAADMRTRVHANVDVPRHLVARWQRGADGSLDYAEALVCGSADDGIFGSPTNAGATTAAELRQRRALLSTMVNGNDSPLMGDLLDLTGPRPRPVTDFDIDPPEEERPCPDDDNYVKVTVDRGAPISNDLDQLLYPPTIPGIPNLGFALHPDFTEWTEEGIRAVIYGPHRWGVQAGVRNLERVQYADEPRRVCLLSRPSGNPFVANIFAFTGDPDAYRSVWADLTLHTFADTVFAQIQNDEYQSSDPWIWTTTEACNLAAPPADIPMENDPAFVLSGDVRFGDPVPLAEKLTADPFGSGFVADDAFAAIRETLGVDLAAGVYDSGVGVHARLVVRGPKHLLIWRPQSNCNTTDATEMLEQCQAAPHFEPNDPTIGNFEVASSLEELGDDIRGAVQIDKGTTDMDILLAANPLPGSASADFRIAKNRRMPWVDALVDWHARAVIENLHATVWDHNKPAYKGDWDSQYLVPNYDVDLHDIEKNLAVKAQLLNAETPTSKPTGGDACSSYTTRSADDNRFPAGLGYVHADLTLGPGTNDIKIREGSGVNESIALIADAYHLAAAWDDQKKSDYGDEFKTDPTVPEQIWMTAISDGKISGDIDLRMNQNQQHLYLGPEGQPWYQTLFTLLFTGTVWTGTDDTAFSMCLDFDLPVELEIDGMRRFRLGMSGAKMALDEYIPDVEDGGSVGGHIGESYCEEDACWGRDGAPYFTHEVVFDMPAWFSSQVEHVAESGRKWKAMAIMPARESCGSDKGVGPNSPYPCYNSSPYNTIDLDDFEIGERGTYRWGELLIDPFFTPEKHEQMWDRDEDGPLPGRPGGALYKTLNARYVTPTRFHMPYDAVTLENPAPDGVDYYEHPSKCTVPKTGKSTFGYKMDPGAEAAVGVDGTRYQILWISKCHRRTGPEERQFKMAPMLVAIWPNNMIRWVRPIETEDVPSGSLTWKLDGNDDTPNKTWKVTLSPRRHGGIHVQLLRTSDANIVEWRFADYDASGYGYGHTPDVYSIGTFLFGNNVGEDIELALNGGPPDGGHRVWRLGDGRVITQAAGDHTATLNHAYDLPGRYWAHVIDWPFISRYKEQGAAEKLPVHDKGFSIFVN